MGVVLSLLTDAKKDPNEALRCARDDCVFCRIEEEARTRGGAVLSTDRIVYQNERLLVFPDIRPAARLHLLVIPRVHIANVRTLTAADRELVREMEAVGRGVLLQMAADAGLLPPTTPRDDAAGMAWSSGGAGEAEKGLLTPRAQPLSSSESAEEEATVKPEAYARSLDARLGLKLGYHVPPFRSVDHLHLHCFLLPHTPWWIHAKYFFRGIWEEAAALEKQLGALAPAAAGPPEKTAPVVAAAGSGGVVDVTVSN